MEDLNKEVAQGKRAVACNRELITKFNCAGQESLKPWSFLTPKLTYFHSYF